MLLRPAGFIHTSFMRFPIDVVFLDRELQVVGLERHVRPWRAVGRKGARAVLELPSGEAEARGVRLGDRLVAEPARGATSAPS